MERDQKIFLEDQNSPVVIKCEGESASFREQWKQMGEDERMVSVQEEMKRMHRLPANSSYATHRLRVLNKIMQLMSIQRSASEDEELELLFSGLSI